MNTNTITKEPLKIRLVQAGAMGLFIAYAAREEFNGSSAGWIPLVGVGLTRISSDQTARHNWVVGGLLVIVGVVGLGYGYWNVSVHWPTWIEFAPKP